MHRAHTVGVPRLGGAEHALVGRRAVGAPLEVPRLAALDDREPLLAAVGRQLVVLVRRAAQEELLAHDLAVFDVADPGARVALGDRPVAVPPREERVAAARAVLVVAVDRQRRHVETHAAEVVAALGRVAPRAVQRLEGDDHLGPVVALRLAVDRVLRGHVLPHVGDDDLEATPAARARGHTRHRRQLPVLHARVDHRLRPLLEPRAVAVAAAATVVAAAVAAAEPAAKGVALDQVEAGLDERRVALVVERRRLERRVHVVEAAALDARCSRPSSRGAQRRSDRRAARGVDGRIVRAGGLGRGARGEAAQRGVGLRTRQRARRRRRRSPRPPPWSLAAVAFSARPAHGTSHARSTSSEHAMHICSSRAAAAGGAGSPGGRPGAAGRTWTTHLTDDPSR